jgi:hypothetical protein
MFSQTVFLSFGIAKVDKKNTTANFFAKKVEKILPLL